MGLGLDPVALQSLLQGVNPQSLMQGFEAQQDQGLGQLAELVRQSQGQAQQAQSDFSQASQAPPPQASGFIDQLFGNVGSVLSGDPRHGERAAQRTQTAQGDLMEARKQNLLSLQSIYAQKADAAERLGNLEMAEKSRTSHERISRAIGQLESEQKFQRAVGERKEEEKFKASQNELDRASAERIAGMRVAGSGAGQPAVDPKAIPTLAESVLRGETRLTDYPSKDRDEIVTYIASTGQKILPPKVRDTLNTLKAAKGIMRVIERLSKKINTSPQGKGGVGTVTSRLAHGTKMKAQGLAQTNPDASIYESSRKGFLATIARASGERGVLTDQDIARARSLMPSFLDTKEVAEAKIKQIKDFISEMEAGAVTAYAEKLPMQAAQAPSGATPADEEYARSLGLQ